MKPVWLPLVAAILMAASPSRAAQVVLDFETLGLGSGIITMSSYQANGFSLTSDIDPIMQSDAFAAWGTGDAGYTGSIALFNQYAGSATTLATIAAGQTFDLSAIDLAPALGDGGVGATVQFRGLQADGTHLSGNCAFGITLSFSTCKLPTFTGLVSVTWTQGDIPHQFDNLVLTTPVPEPTRAAMLLAGLALLANRKQRPR